MKGSTLCEPIKALSVLESNINFGRRVHDFLILKIIGDISLDLKSFAHLTYGTLDPWNWPIDISLKSSRLCWLVGNSEIEINRNILFRCTTQLRRNVAAVESRWQHCVRFDRPGNRTLVLPPNSDVLNRLVN